MRGLKSLLYSIPLFLSTATAIFEDQAYSTDWHISLLGRSIPDSTFFHQPQIDSKASLIYTLTEQHVLGAIKPKDGSLVWRTALEGEGKGIARKSTEKIVSGLGGNVQTRRAADGKLVWENSFKEGVRDLRVEENQHVVALFEDGRVRRLDRSSGDVIWEWDSLDKDDYAHSIIYSFGKPVVVSVTKDHKLRTTQLDSDDSVVYENTNIVDPESEFIGFSEGTGVIFWMESNNTILKSAIVVAKQAKKVATMDPDYEIQSVRVYQSSATSYFLHFQAKEGSWIESYFLTPMGLEKVYNTASTQGESALAPGQPSSEEKPIPFTWITPFEGIKIQVVNELEPQHSLSYNYTGVATISGFKNAISEVIEKADKTYAVRSFVTGANGDTHLLRDGKVVWTRQESLAGAKHSVWVELLDAKTEEIKEDIELEAHTNFVAAYVHRTTRHAQELMTYGLPWLQALPKRILNNILNGDMLEEDINGPYKDFFGFRKYLVILNDDLVLSALNVGQEGKLVWQLDLKRGDAKLGKVVSLYSLDNGVLSIVDADGTHVEIDGYGGRYISSGSLGKKIKATTVIDDDGKQTVVGFTPCGCAVIVNEKQALSAPVHIAIQTSETTMTGYKLTSNEDKAQTWQFSAPPGSVIRTVTTRPTHDPIASIGRVNADRSVLYKYIHPHLLSIITTSASTSTLTSYLLDSISGSILHTTTHEHVDITSPPLALLTGSSYLYTFLLSSPTTKSHTLISTTLFESSTPNSRGPLSTTPSTSSLDPTLQNSKPFARSQAYLLPSSALSLTATSTAQGITTKEILLYLPTSQLLSLPYRLLSPLRPTSTPDDADREEFLPPYSPVLPFPPDHLLTHARSLSSTRSISLLVNPAGLESTSIVALVGEVDIFGTRVAPSSEFDRLGKGFSRVQLVATVLVCFVGVLLVKPGVGRKVVGRKWRGV